MNTVDPIRKTSEIEQLKSCLNGRDLLLFIVGINTSLRISDLLALRIEQFAHISDKRPTITITEQKTGKAKTLFINDSVRKAIDQLVPAGEREGWLFPSRKGDKAISRVQAWRILKAGADRAGLDHIAFGTHTLRKTFAYHAYNNGTDLSVLMKTLNHSSQRETLKYIGIEQQQINEVYINVNL